VEDENPEFLPPDLGAAVGAVLKADRKRKEKRRRRGHR
jgi:hypothetical protein